MTKNLDTYIVRRMVVLTFILLSVLYLGLMLYFFVLDALFPEMISEDKWQLSDLIALGLILGAGIATASFAGIRLAQRIVVPLKSVAAAARAIAHGDFSARAGSADTPFGEADSLIADFNAMAERLEKAEAELKYSNSSIAHELRTPLTILRGRLQGLLDGAYPPEPQLFARLITHVEDLSTIVEDLRTLAMTNAGQLELNPEQVDLAAEAEAVLASTAQDLLQAGITLERRLEPAETRADRARVRQALLAMLDNARRYAPGSTVTVQTGVCDDDVFLRCTDTGPGLPAEQRECAFERFWRAEASRARASGGSGLGLPIIRAIARAHGGEASLVACEGTGLAVEMRLPTPRRA